MIVLPLAGPGLRPGEPRRGGGRAGRGGGRRGPAGRGEEAALLEHRLRLDRALLYLRVEARDDGGRVALEPLERHPAAPFVPRRKNDFLEPLDQRGVRMLVNVRKLKRFVLVLIRAFACGWRRVNQIVQELQT